MADGYDGRQVLNTPEFQTGAFGAFSSNLQPDASTNAGGATQQHISIYSSAAQPESPAGAGGRLGASFGLQEAVNLNVDLDPNANNNVRTVEAAVNTESEREGDRV